MSQGLLTKYHFAYRRCRAEGLSKIEALKASQKSNFEDYKAYCQHQENRDLLQPLDEKDEGKILKQLHTRKLD